MTMALKEEERRLLRADKYDGLRSHRLPSAWPTVEQWSVWEAADYLRLPSGGPFVVIAAEVQESAPKRCRKSSRSCAARNCTPRGDFFPTYTSG